LILSTIVTSRTMSKAKGVGFDKGSLTVGIGGRFFTVQAADPRTNLTCANCEKAYARRARAYPFRNTPLR
jgi:hypothetical protein